MNKLMILTKDADIFAKGSYMLLKMGTAFIIVPFDYKDTHTSKTGGTSYPAELYEFKDKLVKVVPMDWTWLKLDSGCDAREATKEELETFLSMGEYVHE